MKTDVSIKQMETKTKSYLVFKRLIDVTLSFTGLVILFPVFLFISILIKLDSRGPVIFKQERFGINKSTFFIYKFRTMSVAAPKNVATREFLDSDKYITRLGSFLRKTSLDELPQLINILLGQMSIVGPRPVILEEADLIYEREKYGANSVKPGLTGWAQINGRDKLDNETKAKFDGEYIEKFGIAMDFRCLVMTLIQVFKKDDVVEGFDVEVKEIKKVSLHKEGYGAKEAIYQEEIAYK